MESYQMLTVSQSSAFLQAEVDYEGPYDILTGQPLQETADTVQEASVSDSVNYDFSANMFRCTVLNSEYYIYASVAPGMVTTQPVTIEPDEQVDVVLYLDGEPLDQDFSEPIKTPGKYDLVIEQVDAEFQLFSFTIVNEKTGLLGTYQMPAGFYVTELIYNGETQAIRQAGAVDLSAEGDYEITYRCGATNVDYHLDLEMDHTPPTFTLEGAENGYASGPVTLTGLEDTDTVSVLFNGKSVRMPFNDVLTSPGDYELTVTDDAGNAVTENLTIRMYLNSQGLIFSILALVMVVALAVYVYVIRKRLRVQ